METFNSDNRLRSFSKLFRAGEFIFVLLLISWTSTRLPLALKTSGEYLRQLITFIIRPLFIFILSNIIVLTLFVKFSQSNNADTDLYQGLLTSEEIGLDFAPEPIEIMYQDKHAQIIQEPEKSLPKPIINKTIVYNKSYTRSKSVNMKIVSVEKPEGKLRRSETEKFKKFKKPAEKEELVEKLSNEDFQRTIEAFIARQLKFHKEEKLAILVPAITSK